MWVEKNGATWRIRDEVAGRKVDIAKGYPNKTAAKDAMVQFRADQLRGDALVPRGARMPLAQFVGEWWPGYERSLKPSALKSERSRLDCHILPMIGHLELGELDSLMVQAWVGKLEEGTGAFRPGSKRRRRPLSPKTIANCHGLLFIIMAAAVRAKLIRSNPCAGTALPERVHHEMRFLTDPEIARLIKATPRHWRPLVILLVATGLRWGEAIGLRVGRVDLLAAKPKLVVLEHLHEIAGTAEMVWTSPKSQRSRRTVSFGRDVALQLVPLVTGKAPDDVVFTAPQGGMVRTRNFRRGWVKWTKAAGLEGLRIHDLRHTQVAILIAANRPLSAVSRRLGHASIAVTDTLYGHLREEVDDGILLAVDDALGLAKAVWVVDVDQADELAGDDLDPVDVEAEVAAELADELDELAAAA
jgi:site-specific recombinase XerC